ncbi:hypothetical protein PAMA_004562 [Pampus argenteus]
MSLRRNTVLLSGMSSTKLHHSTLRSLLTCPQLQLDPVWHDIGSELKSLGSLVNVGKSDATANTGLAKEFRVRNYPAILVLKKDVKYNYSGPRTKDGIMDFANRIAGLSPSPLCQQWSSLKTGPISPTMVNKDEVNVYRTSFKCVSEEHDGELKSWINRERFPNYGNIDSYTLYAMGESGKLVLLVLVEEKHLCEESLRYDCITRLQQHKHCNLPVMRFRCLFRYKSLVEKVAADYREIYSRNFYFGFMEGNDYVNGLVMGEVMVPSFIMVNLSSDSYFLPLGIVETEHHLLDFLDKVLDGSVQGGNGVAQRVRRFVYDIKVTLKLAFSKAPLFGCFLVGFPLALATVFCYLCCKGRPSTTDEDDDDTALLGPSAQLHRKPTDKKSD